MLQYISAGIDAANRTLRCSLAWVAICLVSALATCPVSWADDFTARRPNIVLLLADDLGYGELGCQGNAQIPTPHIDSIANNGIRFTDGYVTASYCSPSRAGLISGRYQTRFGYESNPIGARNADPQVGLPATEVTIAERLRDAGYATALIGKWHLGGHPRHNPLRCGFDEFFGFTHEGHFYVPPPYHGVTTMMRRKTLPYGGQGQWTQGEGKLIYSTHIRSNEPPYDADNPVVRGGQPVMETEYLTDAWTREAVDFIDRNQKQPFFLYLAYNAVHSPMQGADKYMERFGHIADIQRRIFAAMLSNLDDSVGAVLDKLRAAGLTENTLVFFISDNGGPTRELTSSNLPLRGGKGSLYEGGIRVPFLVQWKGTLPAGVTYRYPVVSLDVYAMAAHLAGAPAAADQPTDGVNLLPYLQGNNRGRPHGTLYWRMNRLAAIRVGDWKLVRGRDQRWGLYDLSNDISESHDLAKTRPDKYSQLRAAWQELDREMVAP